MISFGDGIFTDLQSFNVPWKTPNIAEFLNRGYSNHSARKCVSPFVLDVAELYPPIDEDSVSPLTQEQRTIIASTIYYMFINKWNRMWELYNIEYNPIHDYNLVENETIDSERSESVDRTGTVGHSITHNETDGGTDSVTTTVSQRHTGTDTTVLDGESTETGTVTGVLDKETTDTGTIGLSESTDIYRGIYGFNSATDQGDNTEQSTHASTETRNLAGTEDSTNTETRNLAGTEDTTRTETKDLTDSENKTESRTRNLTHTESNSDTETRNLSDDTEGTNSSVRELTKSGNVGFNTPQEMLAAELDFWKWNFFKSVFEDIDSMLTICIY